MIYFLKKYKIIFKKYQIYKNSISHGSHDHRHRGDLFKRRSKIQFWVAFVSIQHALIMDWDII